MAERTWTVAQQAAIDFCGDNLILSAAAGSGKTATLTQRIIRLLTDPREEVSLSRMLIVTFTNAAAGELRSRIADALTAALAKDPGNRRLLRELTILPGAKLPPFTAFFFPLFNPITHSLDCRRISLYWKKHKQQCCKRN